MKKVETFVLGMVQVNTYLLWNDGHVLIIDPGSNSPKIRQAIEEEQGIVDGIVLTHGHFDHIAGVDVLVQTYHCPLYINDLDRPLLSDPSLNCSQGMGMQEVIVKTKAKSLHPGIQQIGSFTLTCIDAPGHSEGCSMIQWEDQLFAGDVLFAGSIGRCDLPGGSNTKMMQSLRLFHQMDANLKIYPGHGPATTLQQELLTNPYL